MAFTHRSFLKIPSVILFLVTFSNAQPPEYLEVKLHAASDTSLFIGGFDDFEDIGRIGKEPFHDLVGMPQGFLVEYYGYSELSGKEELVDIYKTPERPVHFQHLDEAARRNLRTSTLYRLGPDYPLGSGVDSMIDFVVGTSGGEEFLIIDTNNDEDLANEKMLSWADHERVGVSQAQSQAQFEYLDRGVVRSDTVDFRMFRLENYRQGRTVYKGQVAEYRRGVITVNGKELAVALSTNGHPATYDLLDMVSVCVDFDGDGTFGNWEAFRHDRPFQIFDEILQLAYASPDGRTVLLERKRGKQQESKSVDLAMLQSGAKVPNFSLTKFDGTTVELSDFHGKVTLLDFWAIWCGPCLEDLPKLSEVYEKFRGEGFEIIGVLSAKERAREGSYREFLQRKEVSWNQAYSEDLVNHFNVSWIPHYVLISRDGRVLINNGPELRGNLSAIVEATLADKKPEK